MKALSSHAQDDREAAIQKVREVVTLPLGLDRFLRESNYHCKDRKEGG